MHAAGAISSKRPGAWQDRQASRRGGVAIAQDGSGDQLVFLRAGDVFAPVVLHWFHETGELVTLADDFAALERFVPKRKDA